MVKHGNNDHVPTPAGDFSTTVFFRIVQDSFVDMQYKKSEGGDVGFLPYESLRPECEGRWFSKAWLWSQQCVAGASSVR